MLKSKSVRNNFTTKMLWHICTQTVNCGYQELFFQFLCIPSKTWLTRHDSLICHRLRKFYLRNRQIIFNTKIHIFELGKINIENEETLNILTSYIT